MLLETETLRYPKIHQFSLQYSLNRLAKKQPRIPQIVATIRIVSPVNNGVL